ncbi:iron-containing alcohol dehydrogenase [Leucobacter musarum]|uniref:iron-containing alcohol dehydrogenase n=1 Tax=Leucobacter musarum TaxID=1930747 RepID=UPI000A9DA4A6|nr:iron-containing alcohol dehydrogenase [Leucobacter musarum]
MSQESSANVVRTLAVPPKMRVGGGAIKSVGEVVKSLNASRPVVVTDAFLASTGVAQNVVDDLSTQGLNAVIFSGTVPDPTSASLDLGLEMIRAHQADIVIGLGGGSPIDTAKALAVLAVIGGSMRDLKAPVSYAGEALPIVAIPTTAGTGSEATQFTVISDSETGEKMLCGGPSYLPVAAIVDYELTLTMPARLTADTGIDALTHAVEAYVSKKANGFSDALALGAIQAIGQNLRTAYFEGGNVEARAAMMQAATYAGIAFSNSSVALVHAMSRPIGAHFHVAHGMANAMLFAEVTRFSLGVADDRYAACARALGVASADDSDTAAAEALVRELQALKAELEVPTPERFGVSAEAWEAAIPEMAQQAIGSGSHLNNPKVPDASEIEALYRAIY